MDAGYAGKIATRIRAAGVKPKIEEFEPGHIMFANRMIEEGLIAGQPNRPAPGNSWASPRRVKFKES